MKVQPIEVAILEGLVQRLATTFKVIPLTSLSNDRRKLQKRAEGGNTIKYPQMLVRPSSISENTQGFNKLYLTRFGLDSFFENSGNRYRVKLRPALFNIEVTYITNDSGSGPHGLLTFGNLWLFAKDSGKLKFDIKYGDLKVSIHAELDGDVSFQDSESIDGSPKEYLCTVNLIIHGYVSNPELELVGTVEEVQQDIQVRGATSYWSFK